MVNSNLPFAALATSAATGAINVLGAFASKPKSMMSRAAAARLEPNAIIDQRCLLSPVLNDVLSVATNVWIATYLQLQSMQQAGVSPAQIIKRVSLLDTRQGSESLFSSMLSVDAPNQTDPNGLLDELQDHDEALYEEVLPGAEFYSQEASAPNQRLIDGLNDRAELAIGRMIELEFPIADEQGKTQTRSVWVAVRMMSTMADTQVLKDSMQARFRGSETALERKHGWKSGRLSFISDLIFGSDQVRLQRRRLMRDTSGIYDKLSPSSARNRSFAELAQGKYSIAEASSVLVIDQDTADEVEQAMGGQFRNKTFRERMFESTGIMTMAIIDRGNDMVTFYFDSIAEGSRLNSSALKSAGKKDGPDVAKILESFLTGSSPRFS